MPSFIGVKNTVIIFVHMFDLIQKFRPYGWQNQTLLYDK